MKILGFTRFGSFYNIIKYQFEEKTVVNLSLAWDSFFWLTFKVFIINELLSNKAAKSLEAQYDADIDKAFNSGRSQACADGKSPIDKADAIRKKIVGEGSSADDSSGSETESDDESASELSVSF